MHPSRFTPKAGERHRAMVRSALSIYEQSMGDYLGFGRAVEASRVESRLRSRRRCSQRQLRSAKDVVRVRNNESHFAGPAFGFDRALVDVRSIADALDSFGLTESSARVRVIISKESERRAAREVSPGLLAALSGGGVFLLLYLALNEMGVKQDAGSWSLVAALLIGAFVWIWRRGVM